jgi:NADH-quinone oxidoreductase subunit H
MAPALVAIPALIVLAVVPFGEEVNLFGYQTSLGLVDVNVGVLYILAVTSVAVYGVVLAGWASANKYAMMGGMRATAQMISYELSLGLAMMAPVMMAGSMSIGDIINTQQQGLWFIITQPIAALICYVAMLAEVNRAPFDLPEAEQELVAGYHSEYSGMKFAAFFMGEYMKMIAVSAIFVALFLGGFRFFGLENLLGGWLGPLIMIGKIVASLMLMIWIRATLPRFRYDQLMSFGWKVLLPISLANVVVTAVLVALDIYPIVF